MGWGIFFEGWMNVAWEEAQQNYCSLLKSRHNSKMWAISLIKKLWIVAWDLWEHRNGILHQKDSLIDREEGARLDQKIQQAYYE
jgi:hypothetical protein